MFHAAIYTMTAQGTRKNYAGSEEIRKNQGKAFLHSPSPLFSVPTFKSTHFFIYTLSVYMNNRVHSKFMKTFLTCILLVFSFTLSVPATAFSAAGWYVKPSAEVPLRRGQGKGYKIIAVVSNGTPVELIKENNEWARIRLASGKEGWLLRRYLTPNKPLKDQVSSLQLKNSQLQDKLGETKSRLEELATAHHKTEQELTDCLEARDQAKSDFLQLQQDTRDVVSMKKELALARKQLEVLKKRLADLQLENTGLKKSSSLIWFLVGAGVLLVGWLIGLITGKRTKKRRSSLL